MRLRLLLLFVFAAALAACEDDWDFYAYEFNDNTEWDQSLDDQAVVATCTGEGEEIPLADVLAWKANGMEFSQIVCGNSYNLTIGMAPFAPLIYMDVGDGSPWYVDDFNHEDSAGQLVGDYITYDEPISAPVKFGFRDYTSIYDNTACEASLRWPQTVAVPFPALESMSSVDEPTAASPSPFKYDNEVTGLTVAADSYRVIRGAPGVPTKLVGYPVLGDVAPALDCTKLVQQWLEGQPVDEDSDGLPAGAGLDCDDNDPSVNLGAAELCDGKDNNCNAQVDEKLQECAVPTPTATQTPEPVTPTPINPTEPPTAPEPTPCVDEDSDGLALCQGDCDDTDSDVHPGAAELCDGKDNNCNAQVDEGFDADGDGYESAELCPDLGIQLDCDDTNGAINPGALEDPYDGVDQDCDGEDLTDVDGDGYIGTAVEGGDDCDDRNAAINPGATETCDLIDNNCNGQTDEGFDNDGDGHYYNESCIFGKDCNDSDATIYPGAVESCTDTVDKNCDGSTGEVDSDRDGYLACGEGADCNDSASWVYPGAPEDCNFMDDDCDGETDEGVTTVSYRDADGDGHGHVATSYTSCGDAPSGYVASSDDCDDNNATVYPGATELCDGKDNNCDGVVPANEVDSDFDGYRFCDGDCDDNNASINPVATEVCDTIDNDCDGDIDDEDGAVQGVSWFYQDADGDTYGNPKEAELTCFAPSGYVTNNRDCNDGNPAIKPGATELCNSVDDDCDGQTDEGVKTTYYQDGDNDGYGGTVTSQACTAPSGYVATPGDCKDNNAAINPGATESTCNGTDEDCDGLADDHPDADGDGYDACAIGVSGADSRATDCNDSNGAINPGAVEVCDSIDNDCDALKDEGFDTDGDGYTTCAVPIADCNDNNPAIKPGAAETCNGVDDNCNSQVDEGVKTTFYPDADSDTYGASSGAVQACTNPEGYATRAGDCNDNNASINPGATEECDSIDNDCDGEVDDDAINNGVKFNTVSSSYGVVGYDPSLRLEGDWMFTLEVTWAGSAGTLFMINGYEGQAFELVELGVNADGSVGGYYYYSGSGYYLVESAQSALKVGVPATIQFGRVGSNLILRKDGATLDSEVAPNPPVVVQADIYVGPHTGIGKTAPQDTAYDSFSLKVGEQVVLDLLFNEGDGTAARDSSGRGNDASLSNMGWVSLTCPTSP